ncbi:MAG: DUF503 domain-containing protein [Acidimicrobiia bacterium]|nr:DUF503 domain-containing protein [Acidimicrobiia bacterium]MDX2467726.1 DUF503 domain-containing protein [Acidimicrobiia bacterium]
MYVAAVRLELRIRDAHSLKEKRHVIKSVSSHVARTFGVAVAEVDHQDLWNRSALGVAAVAPQSSHLDRILHSVERHMRQRHDIELIGVTVSHLESPE